jgi:hypothetical protein
VNEQKDWLGLTESEQVPAATMLRRSGPSPSYEDYVRHVKAHGPEGVYETAATLGLDVQQLALLQIECDSVEANRKKGRYTVGKKRRRKADETQAACKALRATGMNPGAIGIKLGIEKRTVEKYLAAA